MRIAWTVITSVGVVATLCLIATNRPSQAQGAGAEPRYGVVDLGAVMREFADVKDLQSKLEKRVEEYKKEGEARKAKIEEVRLARDMEHPDEPKWLEQQKELNRLSVELELWSKFEQNDIKAERRDQESLLYKKVLRAVETVAKQRGMDVVFQLDSVDLNDPEEIVSAQRMTARAVIFSAPRVDLTKEVIARVNQASAKKSQ
ncbi:MAG: OmpH family outer membrane protein [Phycisphaerae bacterium]|nr:OmpH family outer membrane protein [Phycisphaerae bacterium]